MQMRCVHGRTFGGTEEDQQTIQVGSSATTSFGVSSVAGGTVIGCNWASGRVLMNLLKLGRLPAVFDVVSGNLLQVRADAVKAKASAH